MKLLWLLVVATIAFSVQACSLTGGRGSPEGTRDFVKDEMSRHGF